MSPGREEHFAAVGLERVDLLLRPRVDAAVLVFVALGEIVGLDPGEVAERGRLLVDQHVIDHLQRREVERAQILRHERPVLRLGDVRVGGEAGDQDIGLGLGVEQMPDMAGMHHVEHAVAHDDFLLARARADDRAQLVDALDLVPVEF